MNQIPSGSRRLRRAAAYATLLVVGLQSAHACRAPRQEQLVSPDEQMARVTDAAVVRVVSAVPQDRGVVEYGVVVLERLAGQPRDHFTVSGAPAYPNENAYRAHQVDHESPAFWARGGGRTMNDPSCRILPSFQIGETYLVLLDQPWTWRSFEHIPAGVAGYDTNDKWLRYVEHKLGARVMAE